MKVFLSRQASADLDVITEVHPYPGTLVVRRLGSGNRDAGQHDRPMALDPRPEDAEIGHRWNAQVEVFCATDGLPVNAGRILAGARAEQGLMMGVEIGEHAIHVYK